MSLGPARGDLFYWNYETVDLAPYLLWYIGMLHDHWMYRPDGAFVKEKVAGARSILNFFSQYQQADGSLKNVPYWSFTDWVVDRPGWVMGTAPIGNDGGSAVLDLQLALAYQVAEELERNLGIDSFAQLYHRRSQQLLETVRRKYWDEKAGMLADTAERKSVSQHANSLAILTGLVSGKDAADLGKKMLADSSLAPASIYFKPLGWATTIRGGWINGVRILPWG